MTTKEREREGGYVNWGREARRKVINENYGMFEVLKSIS